MKIINIAAPVQTTEKLDVYRQVISNALQHYYDLDPDGSIVLNLIEPMSYKAAAIIQVWAKKKNVFYRSIGLQSTAMYEADLFMLIKDSKSRNKFPNQVISRSRVRPTIVLRLKENV